MKTEIKETPPRPAPSIFWLIGFRLARTSIKRTLGEDKIDYIYCRDRGR